MQPLDITTRVSTPENIEFEYRLAGPFRRFPAFLIDFVLRVLFIVSMSVVLTFSGFGILGIGAALTFMVVLLSLFVLEWFYGLFFEAVFNGQTPGKRLMGLRVISTDGHPINAVQATVRNFLRAADFFPFVPVAYVFPEIEIPLPIFAVGLISMSLTRRMQRVGDIAAHTMVVVEEAAWLPLKVEQLDPRAPMLAEHIPATFVMSQSLARAVSLYVERRHRLGEGLRQEIAVKLSGPLLARFGFREDTSADLLLCALYYRDFVARSASDLELAK